MNRSPSSLPSVDLYFFKPMKRAISNFSSSITTPNGLFSILFISLTAIFLGLVQLSLTAQAQEMLSQPRDIDVEIKSGMTEADLLEQFGQPTRKLEDKVSLQATWYYRDTVVFLANGKVTAWSNANAHSRSMASLSAQSSSKGVSSSEIRGTRWSNAWKMAKSIF